MLPEELISKKNRMSAEAQPSQWRKQSEMVNVQVDGEWKHFPRARASSRPASNPETHPPLLLSSEAQFARQLPHVPDRNGQPKMGPDRQAGDRRRRQAGDRGGFRARQISCAQEHLRGHGRPHKLPDGAGVPQRRDGIPPHQPPADCPSATSRRMPFGRNIPWNTAAANPASSTTKSRAEERGDRPARHGSMPALRALLALHPLHEGSRARDVLGFVDRAATHHRRPSRANCSTAITRSTPSISAPLARSTSSRFPLQNARSGSSRKPRVSAQAAPPVATP